MTWRYKWEAQFSPETVLLLQKVLGIFWTSHWRSLLSPGNKSQIKEKITNRFVWFQVADGWAGMSHCSLYFLHNADGCRFTSNLPNKHQNKNRNTLHFVQCFQLYTNNKGQSHYCTVQYNCSAPKKYKTWKNIKILCFSKRRNKYKFKYYDFIHYSFQSTSV